MRAAQLRLKSIQTQLDAAFGHCSTAETAMKVLARVDNARRAIEKARHAAEVIRTHLNEPNHVPADSVDRINGRLIELEKGISNIEARWLNQKQEKDSKRPIG